MKLSIITINYNNVSGLRKYGVEWRVHGRPEGRLFYAKTKPVTNLL